MVALPRLEASAYHDTNSRQTLNPNIKQAAVDEMLVQHLLTERLIRKIFDNPNFTRRNVIAAEIEKVIDALVSLSFNRDDFLKSLDRFYRAIEDAAHTLEDFGEKQQFQSTVYERFFQGNSVKVADTHGIVYTPQAIVDFMCASVEEVLKTEFGLTLGSKGVNILDPCTGTGNFIVNLIRRIPKRDLPRVYREQLFANEVMLLPYYIAALNIEHAYFEITGQYEAFEGMCFVDTLELAEGSQRQLAFMTEKNTERVERQRKTQITVIIAERQKLDGIAWKALKPDDRHTWLVSEHGDEFAGFLSMGSKSAKAEKGKEPQAIFKTYSAGVKTNRDDVAYDFQRAGLSQRMRDFIDQYNAEFDRFKRAKATVNIDQFVRYEKITWDGSLKARLQDGRFGEFTDAHLRLALYRPFSKRFLYFDRLFLNSVYLQRYFFPESSAENQNTAIGVTDLGSEKPFMTMPLKSIADLHLVGAGCGTQCFPFYTYAEDGNNRRENITDWALEQFRTHYGATATRRASGRKPDVAAAKTRRADASTLASPDHDAITKWDIFHYVYGLLHHPGYRTKYADNLKRELPRIPLAPAVAGAAQSSRHTPCAVPRGADGNDVAKAKSSDGTRSVPATSGFWAFADAGKELARLHLDYEKLEPYELKFIETPGVRLSYRVEDKMRLSKDKTSLKVNPSLTLAGIPPEVFQYRLGNRSALEWVIDQYQVSVDKRSGTCSDPIGADDEEYIVRLVGQVVRRPSCFRGP